MDEKSGNEYTPLFDLPGGNQNSPVRKATIWLVNQNIYFQIQISNIFHNLIFLTDHEREDWS